MYFGHAIDKELLHLVICCSKYYSGAAWVIKLGVYRYIQEVLAVTKSSVRTSARS